MRTKAKKPTRGFVIVRDGIGKKKNEITPLSRNRVDIKNEKTKRESRVNRNPAIRLSTRFRRRSDLNRVRTTYTNNIPIGASINNGMSNIAQTL